MLHESEVTQRIIKRAATKEGDFLIPVGWEFEQLLQSWTDALGAEFALILVTKK